MAAILCESIGKLFSNCCRVLTIPCEACGKGCGECGKLFGKGCDELGKLFCTPFFPYLAATFALNTPALVWAIQSALGYSNGCSLGLLRWLIINGAFALSHMVGAMYIVSIIRAPASNPSAGTISATTGLRDAEEGGIPVAYATSNFQSLGGEQNVPGGANSFKRIKHVLCYDKGMAIYIVVFLSWVVWMAMGVSRRLFDADDCDELLGYVSISLVVGYIWMGLVSLAFCCSLLCLR
mmetsp:Transcript_9481/g.28285  ORF Transcript_9481/g.28285 Transcript_9481/m.28285 type:complete len:237 (-) Transcript_9481:223-933(-)